MRGIDYMTIFDPSLTEPPVDTINPVLLSLSRDDPDDIIPDNLPQPGDVALAESLSLVVEDSPLFIPSMDDIFAQPETPSRQNTPQVEANTPSTPSEEFLDEDPQLAGNSDPI